MVIDFQVQEFFGFVDLGHLVKDQVLLNRFKSGTKSCHCVSMLAFTLQNPFKICVTGYAFLYSFCDKQQAADFNYIFTCRNIQNLVENFQTF